jgi:hypothetical protein
MILGNNGTMTTKEKRPQDWNAAEKFQAIIDCAPLDDEAISAYCRQQGLYAHHIKQWQHKFIQSQSGQKRGQLNVLRAENKQLKSELNRKEKALAETAALLVMKKKAQATWGNEVGNGSWKSNVNSY